MIFCPAGCLIWIDHGDRLQLLSGFVWYYSLYVQSCWTGIQSFGVFGLFWSLLLSSSELVSVAETLVQGFKQRETNILVNDSIKLDGCFTYILQDVQTIFWERCCLHNIMLYVGPLNHWFTTTLPVWVGFNLSLMLAWIVHFIGTPCFGTHVCTC